MFYEHFCEYRDASCLSLLRSITLRMYMCFLCVSCEPCKSVPRDERFT